MASEAHAAMVALAEALRQQHQQQQQEQIREERHPSLLDSVIARANSQQQRQHQPAQLPQPQQAQPQQAQPQQPQQQAAGSTENRQNAVPQEQQQPPPPPPPPGENKDVPPQQVTDPQFVIQQQVTTPAKRKKPELTLSQREAILQDLLQQLDPDTGKFERGVWQEVADRHGCVAKTVRRVWNRAQESLERGSAMDVSSRKDRCGAKRKYNREEVKQAIKNTSQKDRKNMKTMAEAVGVSKTFLWTIMKEEAAEKRKGRASVSKQDQIEEEPKRKDQTPNPQLLLQQPCDSMQLSRIPPLAAEAAAQVFQGAAGASDPNQSGWWRQQPSMGVPQPGRDLHLFAAAMEHPMIASPNVMAMDAMRAYENKTNPQLCNFAANAGLSQQGELQGSAQKKPPPKDPNAPDTAPDTRAVGEGGESGDLQTPGESLKTKGTDEQQAGKGAEEQGDHEEKEGDKKDDKAGEGEGNPGNSNGKLPPWSTTRLIPMESLKPAAGRGTTTAKKRKRALPTIAPTQRDEGKEFTNDQRKAILQDILLHTKEGKLPKGVVSKLAEKHTCCDKTIRRIWKRGQDSLKAKAQSPAGKASQMDVRSRKHLCGKRPKYNRDEIRQAMERLPAKQRKTLQTLSDALGVPKTTLWHIRNEDKQYKKRNYNKKSKKEMEDDTEETTTVLKAAAAADGLAPVMAEGTETETEKPMGTGTATAKGTGMAIAAAEPGMASAAVGPLMASAAAGPGMVAAGPGMASAVAGLRMASAATGMGMASAAAETGMTATTVTAAETERATILARMAAMKAPAKAPWKASAMAARTAAAVPTERRPSGSNAMDTTTNRIFAV